MNYKPKLSIITPSYNSCKYIEQTILSVLEQDYDNFEYIIIDGNSTDDTINILKKYSAIEKYKDKLYWISEMDEGQTDAINKGLKLCSGDWFAWLNADDYYQPNLFDKLSKFLSNANHIGVVYGNCFMEYEGLNEKLLLKPKPKLVLSDFSRGNMIYGPSSFFNLKFLKQVGEFNKYLYYWMDYDMYLKLIKETEFQYIDINFANFRVSMNQKSLTTLKKSKKYKEYQKEAYDIWRSNGGSVFTKLFFRRFYIINKFIFLFKELFNNKHYINIKNINDNKKQ